MIERFEYRDTKNPDGSASASLAADQAANLIGQAALHYDPSGRVELVRRDFKGNPLEIARRLNNLPAQSLVDWLSDPESSLEAEEFTQISAFDALNRLTLLYNWHRGAGSRVAVYRPAYNERGLLFSETLTVRARKTADGADLAAGVSLNAIEEIRYNAKGQKIYLARGDAALTEYDYDPETFRLRQIFTTRPVNARPAANRHAQLTDPGVVQDLRFTFDPAGNLVECEDEAYEPVFFRNQQVEPRSQYEYDALYRLTRANGRENSALAGAPENVEGPWTETVFPIPNGDPNAMRNYTQWFDYDAAGNLERLRHQAGPGSWTRRFHLADDSNRLLASWENGDEWGQVDPSVVTHYQFDTHGNTRNLNESLPEFNLGWDHRDMIESIFLGGGGTAYYQYDSASQRTRKRIVNQNGTGYWERIYLGGYELYRRYRSADATVPVEEIDSLHLMEGGQRLLLVDDVIATDRTHADGTPFQAVPVFRFQFSNHLGSSNLELDEQGTIVSYEEFHPYGTSAYRLTMKDGEAPAKRYRYTGMERDEESGLSYHTARYYALWLARWVSADPAGGRAGPNRYLYSSANPLSARDTGGLQDDKPVEDSAYYGRMADWFAKQGWMDEAREYQEKYHSAAFKEGMAEFHRIFEERSREANAILAGTFITIGTSVVAGVIGLEMLAGAGSAGVFAKILIGVNVGLIGSSSSVILQQTFRQATGARLLSDKEVLLEVGGSVAGPVVAEGVPAAAKGLPGVFGRARLLTAAGRMDAAVAADRGVAVFSSNPRTARLQGEEYLQELRTIELETEGATVLPTQHSGNKGLDLGAVDLDPSLVHVDEYKTLRGFTGDELQRVASNLKDTKHLGRAMSDRYVTAQSYVLWDNPDPALQATGQTLLSATTKQRSIFITNEFGDVFKIDPSLVDLAFDTMPESWLRPYR
jgi:RHS repeat-associated protein